MKTKVMEDGRMAGMKRICGPRIGEFAAAMWVAAAADEFLDAYLENRVTASDVRNLAEYLKTLDDELIGATNFVDRATEVQENDWDNCEYDNVGQCVFIEVEPEPESQPSPNSPGGKP